MTGRPTTTGISYEDRLEAERSAYAERTEVHDLPPIFHYWSTTHVVPMLEGFGFSSPDELFALELQRAHRDAGRPTRFASLGAGNCDTEARVARMLLARGIEDFEIDCLELNEAMLKRGRELARTDELSERIRPLPADLNEWEPERSYDAVIANQSLHHVAEQEHLFAAVNASLPPHGRFVASDMIGRNGHLRWPEALTVVRELWRELPERYRHNLQLDRFEQEFEDWDCSARGFEAIRSQDILPLLLESFDFEMFFGFGNVIDPFLDRSFGPHFDPSNAWDREFIDRVHLRDEREIGTGRIPPTHMFATMRKRPFAGELKCRGHLTPEFCARR